MDATATRLTFEEFLSLPEPEDGSKLEYWDGEVIVVPSPGYDHGKIARRLGARLGDFADAHGIGDVLNNDSGFLFDGVMFGPDVSWVRAERAPTGLLPDHFHGPPDLAVEVVSPSDLDSRVAAKVDRYLAGGTKRVWIVRPENRSVTVRTIGGAISELRGEQELNSNDAGFDIEGFTLKIDDIFGPLPSQSA